MTPKSHPLSSLIGSRICHDLISPIGAITNGLELLDMSGAACGPEMSLIGESVENAGARIRFFRIAFGIAGDEKLAAQDVAQTLSDVEKGGRIRTDWSVTGDIPRAEARMAFLAFQCLESAMAYGGTVHFSEIGGRWDVRGVSDRLRLDPPLWAALAQPGQPITLTPALVQFALLPEVVKEAGRQLQVATSDSEISIRF